MRLRQKTCKWVVGAVCAACAFGSIGNAAAQSIDSLDPILSRSTSPDQVIAEVVRLSTIDPSTTPALAVEVLSKFKTYMDKDDFVSAAKLLIQSIGSASPEILLLVLETVLQKYPDLALPLASASASAQPSMAEEIAEVVTRTCPDVEIRRLSSTLSESTGSPMGTFDYLFAGFGQSGVYVPPLGGGGSPIYQK